MDFPSLPIDLELLERPIERDLEVGLDDLKGLEHRTVEAKHEDGIVEPKSLGGAGNIALFIGAGLVGVIVLVAFLRSKSKRY
jgi:hypothetical protein